MGYRVHQWRISGNFAPVLVWIFLLFCGGRVLFFFFVCSFASLEDIEMSRENSGTHLPKLTFSSYGSGKWV